MAPRRVAVVLAAAILVVLAVAVTEATGVSGSSNPEAGLQAGPGPWPPTSGSLRRRLAQLRLPAQSDAGMHIHALLRIYVDGRSIPVPGQIGIDPLGPFLAPLHTHDASGILHVESARPYAFTLGQFFTVWGVRFSDRTLGGYTDRGSRRLRVYANGRLLADPRGHVLRAHDRIVVTYGRPGVSPTADRTPFPPEL
jgi:hypothetical protein